MSGIDPVVAPPPTYPPGASPARPAAPGGDGPTTASRRPVPPTGGLSLVLGLLVLNQWPKSALWLLGTLLGVQLVVDGVTLVLAGGFRSGASRSTGTAAP